MSRHKWKNNSILKKKQQKPEIATPGQNVTSAPLPPSTALVLLPQLKTPFQAFIVPSLGSILCISTVHIKKLFLDISIPFTEKKTNKENKQTKKPKQQQKTNIGELIKCKWAPARSWG